MRLHSPSWSSFFFDLISEGPNNHWPSGPTKWRHFRGIRDYTGITSTEFCCIVYSLCLAVALLSIPQFSDIHKCELTLAQEQAYVLLGLYSLSQPSWSRLFVPTLCTSCGYPARCCDAVAAALFLWDVARFLPGIILCA